MSGHLVEGRPVPEGLGMVVSVLDAPCHDSRAMPVHRAIMAHQAPSVLAHQAPSILARDLGPPLPVYPAGRRVFWLEQGKKQQPPLPVYPAGRRV